MATQNVHHYSYPEDARSESRKTERLAIGLGCFSIGLGLAEVVAPGRLARLIGVSNDDRSEAVLRGYGVRKIATGLGILAQPDAPGWMWGRVAGDMLDLATLGSAANRTDAERNRIAGAAAAVLGVTALDVVCARRLSGHNGAGLRSERTYPIVKTITINRPPEEVYRFWRDFENLPRFMSHLESVQVTGPRHSHWRAKAPAGMTVSWDAEITGDQPDRMISWRSLEGADVENAGSVRFERATGGRGTVVRVELEYKPPAGAVGWAIAKLFGEEPGQQIDDDLRILKQIMETGEVVKSDASIHRGMHPAQPPAW